MDKDDQLIKDLLREGFLTKAPNDFTDRVMNAVAETESEDKPATEYPAAIYYAIIIGSIAAIVGTLYFTNKAFLAEYFTSFTGIFSDLVPSFSLMGDQFSSLNFNLPYSGLIVGIVSIMVALLVFDKFVIGRSRYLNIFVW